MMIQRRAKPNGITFSFISKACADLVNLKFLLGIHAQILKLGFCSDVFVLNSFIHGYSVCGSVDSARRLFDGLPQRLETLVRESKVVFNSYMVNALINMYSKCGSITDARKHFDEMIDKNLVSWTSMVFGMHDQVTRRKRRESSYRCLQRMRYPGVLFLMGMCKEALMVFHEMQAKGVVPNDASITGAIAAYAHLGALEVGRQIHLMLDERKDRSNLVLSTVLVDMYVKCGCLEISRQLFEQIPSKNLVSYNVMILGLGIHGRASDCLEIFSEMLKAGVSPDSVTFVGILSGCAHQTTF